MLLTELILSKRGPLAKVWLSAHQERKLSKQQALGVDVEESCDAILEQEDGATTLRLSGQLMLGVTRIYSRKVQYLLDDCKETREKISMAFRPGIVDLPEDQIRASKNAITFADVPNDFNFMDWNWTSSGLDLNLPPPTTTTAQGQKIDLRPTSKEFGAYNFGRPRQPSLYGSSRSSRHLSHDGETSSHLDSGDFSGVDLGLQFDDMDMSVEQGRHVSVDQARRSMTREPFVRDRVSGSVDRLAGLDGGMDVTFDSVDLGFDFGNDTVELPRLEERSRRESSALSTPPPVSPSDQVALIDVTPRTAARMQKPVAQPKPKRPRLLQADEDIELQDDDLAAANHDNSAILTDERYIPSDPEAVRLAEIVANPGAYFLPTINVNGVQMIYAGPEGLGPELNSLFAFPTNILRRNREEEDGRASPSKRPRIAGTAEDEVEMARRQSRQPSVPGFEGPSGFGDDSFNFGVGGFDDMPPPAGPGDLTTPVRFSTPARRDPSLAPSRAESIAREVQFGEDDGEEGFTLAMFASTTGRRGEGSQAASQSQQITPTKSVVSEDRSRTSSGYSKNTGMAMGLLRRELDKIEEEDKAVQFDNLAQGANRRAASAFFFELLVLGTKDMVKLNQPKPFENISISGKQRLWEEIAA